MSRTRGVTLIELLVVLGIVAVMLAMFIPAIQSARQSAQGLSCKNNLHQISMALEELAGIKGGLPTWQIEPMTAGGWTVEILPFIEPTTAQNVFAGQDFDDLSGAVRPPTLTCPVAVGYDSAESKFERNHYFLYIKKDRRSWAVSDTNVTDESPWVVGNGEDRIPRGKGPHFGGFYRLWRHGGLDFFPGGQ